MLYNVSGFSGPCKFGRSGMQPAYANHAFEDGLFYPVAADYHVKIVPHEALQSYDRGAGPAPTG